MSIQWISEESHPVRLPGVYAVVVQESVLGGLVGFRKWCQAYWDGNKWIDVCEPIGSATVTHYANVELPE